MSICIFYFFGTVKTSATKYHIRVALVFYGGGWRFIDLQIPHCICWAVRVVNGPVAICCTNVCCAGILTEGQCQRRHRARYCRNVPLPFAVKWFRPPYKAVPADPVDDMQPRRTRSRQEMPGFQLQYTPFITAEVLQRLLWPIR